jgi:hypothetical protein
MLATLLVAGCGRSDAPPMGTAEGTVTIDGKPLTEPVQVVFFNATTGQGASGEVEDGFYELETELPAGDYSVFFMMSAKNESDAPRSTESEIVKSIPRKYQTESSPLSETVAEGSNEINLQLTSE